MSRNTKTLSFTCETGNYLTVVSICAYAINRKPTDAERLLNHLIAHSRDKVYYNGSGKRQIAIRELKLSTKRYHTAFKALISTGCIIKIPNDSRSNFCYYKFCSTINRLIKK